MILKNIFRYLLVKQSPKFNKTIFLTFLKGIGGLTYSDFYRNFFKNEEIDFWAQSYQQKFSDLRNSLKKSENFKPTIFGRKVRKKYLANILTWLAYKKSRNVFLNFVISTQSEILVSNFSNLKI
jgi:nucleoid-associated protein YejK